MSLVQRLQKVHRIDHAPRLRMRQLGDKRFDGVEVGGIEPDLGRRDVLLLDAPPECRQVLTARAHREEHPQHHHRQTRVAQLPPCQA